MFMSYISHLLNNWLLTNNCVEGWQKKFKPVVQCANSGVFKCITAIMKQQKTQSMYIDRKINSSDLKKKKYKDLDKRLKSIVPGANKEIVLNFVEKLLITLINHIICVLVSVYVS